MTDVEPAELTERQFEILERIVQRKAYKVIAAELDISETRVKQHVRAIKDRLEANSMPELVAYFHGVSSALPFTKGEEPKMEVPPPPLGKADEMADDPGAIHLADAMPMELYAPWHSLEQPRVVPGALDGEHAGLRRVLVIVGIVIGLLAAIILALTTASALSEQFRGSGFSVMENKS